MTNKRKDLQIIVTGKHLDITDGIREHVEDKVSKLPRFYSGLNFVEVIIESNKSNQSVEVIARGEHNLVFVGKEEGNDVYTCIDMAVHKVEPQLKKHKEKERNKKHLSVEQPEM